jgi:hypothetical protein
MSAPQTAAYLSVRLSISPLPYHYEGKLQYVLLKNSKPEARTLADSHHFVDEYRVILQAEENVHEVIDIK